MNHGRAYGSMAMLYLGVCLKTRFHSEINSKLMKRPFIRIPLTLFTDIYLEAKIRYGRFRKSSEQHRQRIIRQIFKRQNSTAIIAHTQFPHSGLQIHSGKQIQTGFENDHPININTDTDNSDNFAKTPDIFYLSLKMGRSSGTSSGTSSGRSSGKSSGKSKTVHLWYCVSRGRSKYFEESITDYSHISASAVPRTASLPISNASTTTAATLHVLTVQCKRTRPEGTSNP